MDLEIFKDNVAIETAISDYYSRSGDEVLISVLESLANQVCQAGCVLVPVDENTVSPDEDGANWLNIFTSYEQIRHVPNMEVTEAPLEAVLTDAWYAKELAGVAINPAGRVFLLKRPMVGIILESAAESMSND